MLRTYSFVLAVVGLSLCCSEADAQLTLRQVAEFKNPDLGALRFTGGREVAFSGDGTKMIAAFYGSNAQLFDLEKTLPIGEPIRTGGDGEVGFVNNEIAYTADWNSLRLWNTITGNQLGGEIPHELREDTIIPPAIHPHGDFIATRATMQSVQIWNVTEGKPVANREYSSEVSSLRYADDGTLLFVRAGGRLMAIDPRTGEDASPAIRSGWRYKHFAQQAKLLTTEQSDEGVSQLVIRATDQEGWPEVDRFDLPGKLAKLIDLNDSQVLVQATKKDYTPALFTISLDSSKPPVEITTNADRAFDVVVASSGQVWVCSNIRNISCQRFGELEPIWQMPVPPSGYDKHLFPFNDEHFVIHDKDESFGVYQVADGQQVWKQSSIKRFSLANDKLALCHSEGVDVWVVE